VTVLLDSWAWVEYWRGGRGAAKAASFIEGDEDALVSAVNLAELYHWVLLHYDEATAEVRREAVESRCFIIPLDAEVAVSSARIKKAEKLALADSIVLATGRARGATVVSGDPDLKGKDGVTYIGI